MSQKIAVAIIHGVGKQDPGFADGIIEELKYRFANNLKNDVDNPTKQIEFEPIYWAPAVQVSEDELWKRMKQGGDMDFTSLRNFMVDFAGDAVAYQPTINDRQIYDDIHEIFAEALHRLSNKAGAQAPLCVISHSLGTIITSNYFYDLHNDLVASSKDLIAEKVKAKIGDNPLEKGETLTLLYTLGSPMAIWSLRYDNPLFGIPIKVPSPNLKKYYPELDGEWINYYDKDDVIGYPLKTLNEFYSKSVKEDREINAGGFLTSWNPASHMDYWTDNDVTIPIAEALANVWKKINQ